MDQLKILLLEDNLNDAELIKNELNSNLEYPIEYEQVSEKKEFFEKITQFKPDIILSDYSLPRYNGLVALSDLKKTKHNIPFIIVTGTLSEESAADAIKRGAWDYVVKERLFRLSSAVKNALKLRAEREQIKHTQEELRESEERFRTLFEQSQDAIYILYHKRFERVNRRFVELFGYTLDELQHKDFQFMDIIHSSSKPLLEDRMHRYQIGEKLDPIYEFTALRKDGSKVECEASVTYVDYKEDFATQGIIRDITSRKRAEEEIRKLDQAVEQSPVSVMITDLDGTVEYVNQRFFMTTGYHPDEIIGKNPRILKSGEMDAEGYKKLWDTIISGDTWNGEFHNRKKNGELFWEETIIAPMLNQRGEPTHYLALKEDITERKKLEEQFRQAQKMEAVGHLAGGIAHDFNNLLTVINGFSELLLAKLTKDDPMFKDLQQIKQAGLRAGALTRQLLAFSRKQILRPEVLDMNNLVMNMEKMLTRLITENIDLTTIYTPNLKRVKMDPGQLEQVLMNLVVNARDAMPDGGSLTIETSNLYLDDEYVFHHEGTPTGWYVLLDISDSGCGMDRETQKHIFEPFFTTKEKGKGTGLGLSTVYGIIKQSGGNIWVYSEPGIGTTFKIYLPALEQDEKKPGEPAEIERSLQGTETILVVEDENAVRELTRQTLKKYGYTVISAENSEAALDLLKKSLPDIQLILTDVIMPGMNGRALAQEAKKLQPNLKILFMSGYTDDAIVRHGVLEDGVDFIHKPFSTRSLTQKIREILDAPDPQSS